jgi:hypothetical protein
VTALRRLSSSIVVAGLVLVWPSAFAQSSHAAKIDRSLKESVHGGASTMGDDDNIVWGTPVLKGTRF